MSEHKRIPGSASGAERPERAPVADPGLPVAPVPVPMVARGAAEAEPAVIHRLFKPPPLTRQDRVGNNVTTTTSSSSSTSTSSSAGRTGGPPPLSRQNRFGTPSPRDPHMGGELDDLANYEIPEGERQPKDDGSTPDMYEGTPIGKLSGESMKSKRERVEAIKAGEAPKDKAPHQPTDDLGETYAHIGMIEAEFKHQVGGISTATAGKASFRPGGKLKGLDRAFEKADGDYKGDLSRMVDISGGSISYDTPEALVAAYGVVRSWEQSGKSKGIQFKVVRVKNSLVKGEGYGDLNLSVEMGGAEKQMSVIEDRVDSFRTHAGYNFELQLHLEPIIGVKTAAHKQYEGMRSIEARNKKAQRGDARTKDGWDTQDRQEYQSLEDQMNAMYGTSWASIGPWAGVKAVVEQVKPFNDT